jgi:hypothetical protein
MPSIAIVLDYKYIRITLYILCEKDYFKRFLRCLAYTKHAQGHSHMRKLGLALRTGLGHVWGLKISNPA